MAVKKIASNVEVMLIVGSENSSNSQRLVEVAKNEGCVNSYLVSDVNFINWNEINNIKNIGLSSGCLLYTSPSPRDLYRSRMPSSA